jgi:hypothetical protein
MAIGEILDCSNNSAGSTYTDLNIGEEQDRCAEQCNKALIGSHAHKIRSTTAAPWPSVIFVEKLQKKIAQTDAQGRGRVK